MTLEPQRALASLQVLLCLQPSLCSSIWAQRGKETCPRLPSRQNRWRTRARWPASQGRVLSALIFLGLKAPRCFKLWTRCEGLNSTGWEWPFWETFYVHLLHDGHFCLRKPYISPAICTGTNQNTTCHQKKDFSHFLTTFLRIYVAGICIILFSNFFKFCIDK